MFSTFKLEDYLGRYEFSAPYLLCCSDAESWSMHEIVNMASPEERALWDNLRLGYTEVQGLPALREAIADKLYTDLKGDNILCFSGAEEGIFCALSALCEPSDHAIVLTPCYQSLLEMPKFRGCDVTQVELREENDWKIDTTAIKNAIRNNTKLVITNFPHNPTGQVIAQPELDELIAILDHHGIWLFSDEVYRLLGTPKDPWSKPAACCYPKALSLGVMSKAFGMAGLRIGWIACQDREIFKKTEHIKHYTSICSSAPAEILSLITLNNQEQVLERNNKIVADNLKLLDVFFSDYSGLFSWVRPQGGCVGFVNYKAKESIVDFCKRLADQAGVLLMPASIYGLQSNYFRIGFGRENMPEALEKFREFLHHENLSHRRN